MKYPETIFFSFIKKGPVYALVSNPSGVLFSGGKDGIIKVWESGSSTAQREIDLKTNPNARTWQDEGPNIIIRTLAWNPVSNLLHVGTKEGDIYNVHLEENKVEAVMNVSFFLTNNYDFYILSFYITYNF